MEIRGVNYDVGQPTVDRGYTRPILPDDLIAREVALISNHLQCKAIRITGDRTSRIATAAKHAAAQGMAVWLSPSVDNATPEERIDQLEQTAAIANELHAEQAEMVAMESTPQPSRPTCAGALIRGRPYFTLRPATAVPTCPTSSRSDKAARALDDQSHRPGMRVLLSPPD